MPTAYTVEQYLRDLRAIHFTGNATDETSFYPPLANLLNAAGDTLKPKVLFSTQLRDDGAGRPDGGLFPQPKRRPGQAPQPLQTPERGAVEIKGPTYSLDTLQIDAQTRRYLLRYGLVLITNYREFRLLKLESGIPVTIEHYTLAASPDDLWHRAQDPKHAQLLPDFLRRVMLYQVPITDPKDVAWFLASYAREARARAEDHDLPFFRNVKSSLEESLGITFEGEKGDHFFRSTLVQTLFYGIFSAWVLWRRSTQAVHHAPSHPLATFNWRLADDFLHVPILRKLFREISDRRTLDSIQIAEILDLAANVLNRVQPSLFDVFRVEEAVAYFYEPFLEAFDPELRKELGVWYTPREIVHYMVERVDHLLRTELNQPLGLASPAVRILDPCCGTGAYLTAVLQHIHRTLLHQAGDDTWRVGPLLRKAALERVFGFEIMPAPFVIAHMEISRLLEEAGGPLLSGVPNQPDQRASVFLTNALTGWVPSQHPNSIFQEMEQEREAAEDVKQRGSILVILGNPPYNGYAGIARIDEERDLTLAYRAPVAGLPAPQGQGLNDLYIRFFRIAERRIAANPEGQGIVSFISNNAWLDGLSHTSMRSHFLHTFQQLYIDNLNGDKYRTGKTTPDGHPDPSAFSTRTNREGIQVGTAIATLVRRNPESLSPFAAGGGPALSSSTAPGITDSPQPQGQRPDTLQPGAKPQVEPAAQPRAESPTHTRSSTPPVPPTPNPPLLSSRSAAEGSASHLSIHLRDLWGTHKLSHLERESRRELTPDYKNLQPNPALGLPFATRTVSANYTSWPRLPELFIDSMPGVKTSRDELVIDIDRDELERRMRRYCDRKISNEAFAMKMPSVMVSSARFDAGHVRERMQSKGFRSWQILRYTYRPFDNRWIYWEPESKLLDEKREKFVGQLIGSSLWIEARQRESGTVFARGVVTNGLADNFGNGLSTFFPASILLEADLLGSAFEFPNLSGGVTRYSHRLCSTDGMAPFYHALATMHTPSYRLQNAGALLGDWPRIPLPATAELLAHSAALGHRLANLLDPESTAELSRDFTFLAALKLPRRPGEDAPRPEDFTLQAGWGARGQGSTVMPGRGRLAQRPWTPTELQKLATLAAAQSLTPEQALELLGNTCFDIYLNNPRPDSNDDSIFWTAVPANVWNYTLGGYQVLKKWLSYRELPLLGRPLKEEEAAWFSEVTRRIAAILFLGPALDASYAAILPTATGLPTP